MSACDRIEPRTADSAGSLPSAGAGCDERCPNPAGSKAAKAPECQLRAGMVALTGLPTRGFPPHAGRVGSRQSKYFCASTDGRVQLGWGRGSAEPRLLLSRRFETGSSCVSVSSRPSIGLLADVGVAACRCPRLCRQPPQRSSTAPKPESIPHGVSMLAGSAALRDLLRCGREATAGGVH